MDAEDPLVIVNPTDYTLHPYEQPEITGEIKEAGFEKQQDL